MSVGDPIASGPSPPEAPIDRSSAVKIVAASTLLADAAWLFGTFFAVRSAMHMPVLSGILRHTIFVVFLVVARVLPAISQAVGAVLLLQRRPSGRLILLIHYWLFLPVSFAHLWTMTRGPLVFSQFTPFWPSVALAYFNPLFIITMLLCLHKRSFRRSLPGIQDEERRWIALTLTGTGCSALLFVIFLSATFFAIRVGADSDDHYFEALGGWRLVYQVDAADRPSSLRIEDLANRLEKRLDPTGSRDVQVNALDDDRVEVLVPKNYPGELSLAKQWIAKTGILELRILASEKHDGTAIFQAREKFGGGSDKKVHVDLRTYEWVEINDPSDFNPNGSIPGENVAVQDGHVLTILPDDLLRLTGEDLSHAEPALDEHIRPAVGFKFTLEGKYKFARLTRKYRPEPNGFKYRLAIILDQRVMTAPVIQSPVEGGSGIIEGGRKGFTAEEVEGIVALLNAGALPARLLPDPVEEQIIPPRK